MPKLRGIGIKRGGKQRMRAERRSSGEDGNHFAFITHEAEGMARQ
jgi:hypothetical protein